MDKKMITEKVLSMGNKNQFRTTVGRPAKHFSPQVQEHFSCATSFTLQTAKSIQRFSNFCDDDPIKFKALCDLVAEALTICIDPATSRSMTSEELSRFIMLLYQVDISTKDFLDNKASLQQTWLLLRHQAEDKSLIDQLFKKPGVETRDINK
jgi:hypothetical protein